METITVPITPQIVAIMGCINDIDVAIACNPELVHSTDMGMARDEYLILLGEILEKNYRTGTSIWND